MSTESQPNSPPLHPTTDDSAAAPVVTVAATTPTSTQPPPARKFPAPCWTQEETRELINAYKDKWYSLRCRNLRSADWESVAADLNARCPPSSAAPPAGSDLVTTAVPGIATGIPKTSAQCRHKMEKLRKRYRTEKQRALNHPNRFFASSWVFFHLMEEMETGSCGTKGGGGAGGKKRGVEEFGEDGFGGGGTILERKFGGGLSRGGNGNNNNHNNNKSNPNPRDLGSVPIKFKFKNHGGGSSSLGYGDSDRFNQELEEEEEEDGYGYGHGHGHGHDSARAFQGSRSLDRKRAAAAIVDEEYDDDEDADFPDSRYTHPTRVVSEFGNRVNKRRNTEMEPSSAADHLRRKTDENSNSNSNSAVVGEMVRSIRMLGEGFVRMEKMKAEMVREMEKKRMEMEMRRSEMILESQQVIINAFVDGFLGEKRRKSKKAAVKFVDE